MSEVKTLYGNTINPKTPFAIGGYNNVNDILKFMAKQAGYDISVNYEPVTWLFDTDTPLYGIGDNTKAKYNCWCPHNLQYDSVRGRFIFVQSHRGGHTGSFAKATMHVIHPDDILSREDITIPDIVGIANLLILNDGTYWLYPKTTSQVRYVSTDGGATWTTETINNSPQHFFGIYECNGEYYAGCDYEWGEYHHSTDGLTWTTKALDWTDENGCHTKEHSFCYWHDHVYAFGRRDFYKNDDGSQGLVDDYNGCAVVFRLDGDTWTMVDDESISAFQSNCSPFAFGDCIAIAHIDRLSVDATLNYTLYDGDTFETLETWDDICKDGTQQEFTTPSIAFGDGYVCIAFSVTPIINPFPSEVCVNSIIMGTYEGKSVSTYFTRTKPSENINFAKVFALNPDDVAIYPASEAENISWRYPPSNYDAIVNNSAGYVYFYLKDYPTLMYPANDTCFLVYNGAFVDLKLYGTAITNAIAHNWLVEHGNRLFAVGGIVGDYGSSYLNYPAHAFVIECATSADDIQPDTDLSALANGTIVRRLAAGGTFKQTLKTPAYITVEE